ncbi:MAG: hypothetical protein N2489_07600 [Clostridia bacterium]|nr:hypothetical protein [Clostridia bacterium]
MYPYNSKGYLDNIRLQKGITLVRSYFARLASYRPVQAANILNEPKLSFATLYCLSPEIEKYSLANRLNMRNKTALEYLNALRSRQKLDYTRLTEEALEWVFETGRHDDGLSNEFDGILDKTAAILTKVYRNKSALPSIVDIIFKRNKKGGFIYDLIWAFFEARNADSLMLIADRLNSGNNKDAELAQKLLNFIPGINNISNTDRASLYAHVAEWLTENCCFLQYTGETFNQISNPEPFSVCLEAKYMCIPVSNPDSIDGRTITGQESSRLREFKTLDKETKVMLSDFSYSLHRKDQQSWSVWISSPLSEQIKAAKQEGGSI